MEYTSALDRYIKTNYTVVECNEVLDKLKNHLGSPHRRTTLLKSPERATNVELLQIAEVLNVSPSLLRQLGVGDEGLHEIEKAQYGGAVTNGHQLAQHATNNT